MDDCSSRTMKKSPHESKSRTPLCAIGLHSLMNYSVVTHARQSVVHRILFIPSKDAYRAMFQSSLEIFELCRFSLFALVCFLQSRKDLRGHVTENVRFESSPVMRLLCMKGHNKSICFRSLFLLTGKQRWGLTEVGAADFGACRVPRRPSAAS